MEKGKQERKIKRKREKKLTPKSIRIDGIMSGDKTMGVIKCKREAG